MINDQDDVLKYFGVTQFCKILDNVEPTDIELLFIESN